MINLVSDIKPVSYVKAHTAEIIKQIQEKNSPVVITQNGESKAVLMDVKQYQEIIDLLCLFKLMSIGENDFLNNRVYTQEELDKEIQLILEEK